jgi:hypothetical protein
MPDDKVQHTRNRLGEDMDSKAVPPNPKHGEPGHNCPLDHWFEYRLQGIDIATISRGLSLMQQLMSARIAGEAMLGQISRGDLEDLIKTGDELEELRTRMDKPLDEEYHDQRKEWLSHKEWNL